MTDFYISEHCPVCGKNNFVCLTHSKFDVDGAKCWNCKSEWLFEESMEVGMTFDDAFIVEGEKKPI